MASFTNSTNVATDGAFTGKWEDVQKYTSVHVTVNSNDTGNITLQWANPRRGIFAGDSDTLGTVVIAYATPGVPLTLEQDHRGQWFRLKTSMAVTAIECLYKETPSVMRIVDDRNVPVTITNRALGITLTDVSGRAIGTNKVVGSAMYTRPTDSSLALRFVGDDPVLPKSLGVALRDNRGRTINDQNGALYYRPADVCGHGQAGTVAVKDSSNNGIALYLSSDIDSTRTIPSPTQSKNALCVTFKDNKGQSFTNDNPIPVKSGAATGEIVKLFDISMGITGRHGRLSHFNIISEGTQYAVLYSLYCYNDGPVTIWLKVYDHDPRDGIDPDATRIILNLPVVPGTSRDVKFPQGCRFIRGVCFKASSSCLYTDESDPGDNLLFVSGTYAAGVALGSFLYPPFDLILE